MKVCVTGGAGFVGSAIVRRLLERGDQVRVIDNLSKGRRENLTIDERDPDSRLLDGVELVQGDIVHGQGVALHKAIGECDAVVHAAAYPDVSANWKGEHERVAQWEQNAEGTRAVAEATKRGARFIMISTCSVYAGGILVTEDTVPRATSPYAASKLAAESYCLALTEAKRIDLSIFRLVNVVGPRYRHGHVADFVRKAREGHLHALDDGEKAKSFVHVEDVADEVGEAVRIPGLDERGYGTRIANVTSRYVWSWRDTVEVMRAMRPERAFKVTHENRASGWIGDPDSLVVSSHPFGWHKRRSIVAGVRAALEGLGW